MTMITCSTNVFIVKITWVTVFRGSLSLLLFASRKCHVFINQELNANNHKWLMQLKQYKQIDIVFVQIGRQSKRLLSC